MTLRTITINGDNVILGRNGTALVASKSEQGAWHSVRAGQCDCKGFAWRGRCRHLAAVTAASQPTPVPNDTFALYERTLSGSFR